MVSSGHVRDTELYRQLLGLESPWTVDRVDLDTKARRVDVWAVHPDRHKWTCPECGALLPLYDHAPERVWRHLDSCGFQTFLHARPPRVHCSKDGVLQVRLPWAEPNSRFTCLFERLAIEILREASVSGTAEILGLSWDETWHIMAKAVERGLLRKKESHVERIGVDEKAIAKGHKYMTIVCNIDTGAVEFVGYDRKSTTLDEFFLSLSPKRCKDIRAIALDMWDPFVLSIRTHVPDATSKMVYDRFHVMKHVGKAVDAVRKQEHRELMKIGDDTLKGSKYLWLRSYENLPASQVAKFENLRNEDLKTAKAWALKENLRRLWDCTDLGDAQAYLQRWYVWATHSRLAPVIAAAKTVKRHAENILTFVEHRITNALSESINSKIQTIKQMACGYRNRENFRTAIFFHCGGLDLYPGH